jgi:hypothetical protein
MKQHGIRFYTALKKVASIITIQALAVLQFLKDVLKLVDFFYISHANIKILLLSSNFNKTSTKIYITIFNRLRYKSFTVYV